MRPRICVRVHMSLYGICVTACHESRLPVLAGGILCPTSLPARAATVVVLDAQSAMGSAWNTEENGIVNTTVNGERVRKLPTFSTPVPDGEDCAMRSYNAIHFAKRAHRNLNWLPSLTTRLPSSAEGIAGRGTTCSRNAPRATQGSPRRRGAGGMTGRGDRISTAFSYIGGALALRVSPRNDPRGVSESGK